MLETSIDLTDEKMLLSNYKRPAFIALIKTYRVIIKGMKRLLQTWSLSETLQYTLTMFIVSLAAVLLSFSIYPSDRTDCTVCMKEDRKERQGVRVREREKDRERERENPCFPYTISPNQTEQD